MTATDSSDSSISVDTARIRLKHTIKSAWNEDEPQLIEALPSVGKSFGTIQEAAESNRPLTFLTSRVELFNQVQAWCEDVGLSSRQLPSFHSDCETAKGEYGTKWKQEVRNQYRSFGLMPKDIHREAESLFGEQLPCTREGTCGYLANQDYDPEEYDALVGHYVHAHVPKNVDGRYVVFDEFPEGAFLSRYDPGTWKEAISSLLGQQDNLRFSYPKELRAVQHGSEDEAALIQWLTQRYGTIRRDTRGSVDNPSDGAHPRAPLMTYALLAVTELENQWEYTSLPNGGSAVIDPSNESLTVLDRPDLDGAEGVVALDGTPTVEKWRLLLGDDLQYQPIMSDDEKREYLREEQEIRVIQTTEAAKPYSGRSGISLTTEQDMVLIETVSTRENAPPAVISSRKALEEYHKHGLTKFVDATEHYGNFKGSNKFGEERIGIVTGSPHYGDAYIQKWAALAGESVTRESGTRGTDLDYGPFGNQVLHSMREREVLQAVMRFGRDGNGATVYVHTAALPDWIERTKPVSEIRKWSSGMQEVISAIDNLPNEEWRTRDIHETVSLSRQQAHDHLKSLDKFGYISHRIEGRGFVWSVEKLDCIGKLGHVQFQDSDCHS